MRRADKKDFGHKGGINVSNKSRKKQKDYTVMSNYHLREKKMSLKAKGLLSLMLALPPNWDYSIRGLVSICKEKRTGN